MTEEEWPTIEEPITYSHEEDESEVEDDLVPETATLPGHPVSDELSTDSIQESA